VRVLFALEKGKCGLIFGVGLSEEAKKQEERGQATTKKGQGKKTPTSWRQQTESMLIPSPSNLSPSSLF